MNNINSFFALIGMFTAGILIGNAPSVQASAIKVLYHATEIVEGDITPSSADLTFLGVQTVAVGSISLTFTINNSTTHVITSTPTFRGIHILSISNNENPCDFVIHAIAGCAIVQTVKEL
jgi:hypothetical protein